MNDFAYLTDDEIGFLATVTLEELIDEVLE